jgi:hypothetical protein
MAQIVDSESGRDLAGGDGGGDGRREDAIAKVVVAQSSTGCRR